MDRIASGGNVNIDTTYHCQSTGFRIGKASEFRSWQRWRVDRFTLASSTDFGWRFQPQNSNNTLNNGWMRKTLQFK
jgi:hypothetical protein